MCQFKNKPTSLRKKKKKTDLNDNADNTEDGSTNKKNNEDGLQGEMTSSYSFPSSRLG